MGLLESLQSQCYLFLPCNGKTSSITTTFLEFPYSNLSDHLENIVRLKFALYCAADSDFNHRNHPNSINFLKGFYSLVSWLIAKNEFKKPLSPILAACIKWYCSDDARVDLDAQALPFLPFLSSSHSFLSQQPPPPF